jgi:hypothetical protein
MILREGSSKTSPLHISVQSALRESVPELPSSWKLTNFCAILKSFRWTSRRRKLPYQLSPYQHSTVTHTFYHFIYTHLNHCSAHAEA